MPACSAAAGLAAAFCQSMDGWLAFAAASLSMQHFLYFLPLPHGHGLLRPTDAGEFMVLGMVKMLALDAFQGR